MSTTTNLYEVNGRAIKAQKIAQLFIDKGIDADTLKELDESGWHVAAMIAGTRLPSEATRALVISLVGAFRDIKAIEEDKDPFRGFPKPGEFE